MATTKTPVELKGQLRWVVVPPFSEPQKPMEFSPGQENNTHYSLEVECSDQQYKQLIKDGVSRMTVLKEDPETGKTFIRIKRPKVNGTYTALDPVVKDKNGDPLTCMIANGSEGIVSADIESFESKAGKKVTALRFHTVMVTNLIPWKTAEQLAKEKGEAIPQEVVNDVLNNDDAHAGPVSVDGSFTSEDW